jgi:hypothetical protein
MGISTFIEKDSSSSSASRQAAQKPASGLGAFTETDNASATAPKRSSPQISTKGIIFIDGTAARQLPITYYEIIDEIEYYDIENGERYYETVY